ncbi:hypothetical protein [Labrenzia sp. 011]|uniref:hypothetical protein n=1 Tax=Labrenzia sp. 011 TaxID=2171494 RepID=UPI000D518DD0|nr:hypothetical protein [Labrenzia sp. 011]PVB59863.1 hypothetical protein DCO57_19950 [Labrenzia sp. 011]
MYAEVLEATVLNNTRFEKDPNKCLVYHILDDNRTPLTPEQVAVEWSAIGKGDDALPYGSCRSPVSICAGGDAWVNVLIEVSRFLGYNKTFFDVLEGYYETASTAWPSITFDEVVKRKPFRLHVDSGRFDYFVFSGGGNEILGCGVLQKLLKDRGAGNGSRKPEDYLMPDRLDAILSKLKDGYLDIAQYVQNTSPGTQMLVHGYDYPVARADGPWLGRPFVRRSFDMGADRELIADILAHIIDRFYEVLEEISEKHANVTVVDIRNTVRGRWTDEMHPELEASKDIAAFYRNVIDGYPAV